MTVYEMIQELAKYPPDMEIEVNVYKNGYSAMAEVSEDCSEGEESIVEIDIDENTSSIAISDERKSWGSNAQKYVRILAEL
ncbi:hypothetical protein HMPREF1089_01124 [Enterocloster bolteae 90B3]|nr:hypothetical protein HMPREF1089_01124 [Enterocloster bolteae 90B3]